MWPGEYPPEGRARRMSRARSSDDASMWPGEYPPEGRRSGSRTNSGGMPGLQCGRGSIPRKVPEDWRSGNAHGLLQCGRGSIPRKVFFFSFTDWRQMALQCGRGSIPRKVDPAPLSFLRHLLASMWPGEYPPEGRTGSPMGGAETPSFNVAGGVSPGRSGGILLNRPPVKRASMWPGEYPPEGRQRPSSSRWSRRRFNVAGGVSPGRSRWSGTGRKRNRRLQCGRGSIPRKVVDRLCAVANDLQTLQCGRGSIPRKVRRTTAVSRLRRSLQCGRGSIPRKVEQLGVVVLAGEVASMWPGEYPPEGRRLREAAVEFTQRASMWPGEYPPEGRRMAGVVRAGSLGFNVAGGVSPGRSPRRRPRLRRTRGASMWPGEYPPEGREGRRPRPHRPVASMWPGEYPPEGRRLALGRFARLPQASMWPGEYPPEGP